MAQVGGVGGKAYIAQWPCMRIEIGWALQVAGGIPR